MKLKNTLMVLDKKDSKSIGIDKFLIESENLGIFLSQEDI